MPAHPGDLPNRNAGTAIPTCLSDTPSSPHAFTVYIFL
jgi:hypothetical protein